MPYRFEFERRHRILRACLEGIIGDDETTKFRADIAELISDIRPSACIVDLSDTKEYALSVAYIRSVGRTAPVLPNVSIPVIVVAPAPHIFGATRMFQLTSDESRPWFHVVRSSNEAYKLLHLDSPMFEPLPTDSAERKKV